MVEAFELRRRVRKMPPRFERFDEFLVEQMLCTQMDVTTRVVTRFGPGQFERTAGQMKGYPIGWKRCRYSAQSGYSSDPILGRVKAYASARPSPYPLAWRALEADEVATSLDWVGAADAVRHSSPLKWPLSLALLALDACEALAARCVKLPNETREAIAGDAAEEPTAYRSMRVWVACRSVEGHLTQRWSCGGWIRI